MTTTQKPPPGLVDALVQTSFMAMGVLTRVAAENQLSLTQLRVLGIVRGRRPRMTALADYLGLEKSTMSGLVGRAEARGLLQRGPQADDGRVVEVYLTAEGARLAEHIYTEVAQALTPMLGSLGAADRRRLQQLLEAMLGAQDT